MEELVQLAELVHRREEIDRRIAGLLGRPALPGHFGEFVAARVFDLQLAASAVNPGWDGTFRGGPLAGRTVDVKFYSRLEGLLDLTPGNAPDEYLVLAGPRASGDASREHRPWRIASVHLFEAAPLLKALGLRGVKLGVATSVAREFWTTAEIYPEPRNRRLLLQPRQRELLELFL